MAYCPECGKKVASGATFCAHCGKKIKAEESKPEEKPAEKTEPNQEAKPVASAAPAAAAGTGIGGCGIAAIIGAILLVILVVFGFFALAFVGAKGQPGTIMKPTTVKTPKNLAAAGTDQAINLSWGKSDTASIAKYNVYKSNKNAKDYQKVTTIENANLTYTDTNVTKGITYYYVVTAVDQNGTESGNSNQASYALTPPPLVPQGITSWQDVLTKYNADSKYANVLTQVTGLSKADIEKYVGMEQKGKKLKTTLKKGTIITNTTENYKIIPNFVLNADKEFLTDDKGNPHIMMWCGNPVKLIKKPSPVVQAVQTFVTNIIYVLPVQVTNIIIYAGQPLSTFVVGIMPNSFGTTVMNPEATDTDDEWPKDQILIDTAEDMGLPTAEPTPFPTSIPTSTLEAGQQWAEHGKILLEANPADPGPGESVTMIIHIFPAEAGVSVNYSVSGTDGYSDSGTLTTNAEGKCEFSIPGGAEGVADTINVDVPSRGDSGSTSYSF